MLISTAVTFSGCYRQSSSPATANYQNKYDGHLNKGGHRLRDVRQIKHLLAFECFRGVQYTNAGEATFTWWLVDRYRV